MAHYYCNGCLIVWHSDRVANEHGEMVIATAESPSIAEMIVDSLNRNKTNIN